jgi:hypothetical protein
MRVVLITHVDARLLHFLLDIGRRRGRMEFGKSPANRAIASAAGL